MEGTVGERPSFRKPAHDPSHRNYRRRSPTLSKSSPSPPRRGRKRTRSVSPSPVREMGGVGRVDQVKKVRNSESERGGHKDQSNRSGRREHSPVSERPIQPQHHTHHHSRNHKVEFNDSHSAYAIGSRHENFRREAGSDGSAWGDRPRDDRGYRDNRDMERGRDKGKGLDKDEDRSWGGRRGGEWEGSKAGSMEGSMWGRGRNSSRARATERGDRERDRDRDRRGERESRDQGHSQVSDERGLRYREEKEPNGRRDRGHVKEEDRYKGRGNVKEGDRFKEEEDARVVDLKKDRDKFKDQGCQRDRDTDCLRPREDKNGRCSLQEVWKLKEEESEEAVIHSKAREGDRCRNDLEGGEKDRGRDTGEKHRNSMSRDERERASSGWDQVPVVGRSGKEKTPAVSSVGNSDGTTGREELGNDGPSEVGNHANVSEDLPQGKSKVDTEATVDNDQNAGAQQPKHLDSALKSGEVEGNKPVTVAGGKPAKSSKWGPAPSSEDAMSTEVANDLNAAKLAAMRAAELVNKNLTLAGFMSADHKKKLLWGSKKAMAEQEPVVAAAGTNRWDTVHFSDRDRREKFHKLMGVKGDLKDGEAAPPPTGTAIFTEEKQRELQEDLEKQFTQGLRRRDGRTVGLGL